MLRVVGVLILATALVAACAPAHHAGPQARLAPPSGPPVAGSVAATPPAGPPSPAAPPTPGSAPLPPPVSPGPAPAGWTADKEPGRGFDLSYPPGWAPKAAATGGPDHVYYATADAPAPLEMSATDVWLTVQTEAPAADGTCAADLPGEDGGSVPATLGGRPVALRLRDPRKGQVEPTWKAYAMTGDGRRCYVLWFVTLTQATRTRELATMREILAEFRPTSP